MVEMLEMLNSNVGHGTAIPTYSNAIGSASMSIYHTHHIIPKHMGGTDDPSNLIQLSIEEHAEAHRKLYEEHGNEWDRIAWLGLSGQIDMDEVKQLAIIEAGRQQGNKNRETGHIQKLAKYNSENWKSEWSANGGFVQGKRNVESGHAINLAKMGADSRRGKKTYFNPETKQIKYFHEGEESTGWKRGRK
jgi:hypothetical protein